MTTPMPPFSSDSIGGRSTTNSGWQDQETPVNGDGHAAGQCWRGMVDPLGSSVRGSPNYPCSMNRVKPDPLGLSICGQLDYLYDTDRFIPYPSGRSSQWSSRLAVQSGLGQFLPVQAIQTVARWIIRVDLIGPILFGAILSEICRVTMQI